MKIRLATLGMAHADYVTNCSECRASLMPARGQHIYHAYEAGKVARTVCKDCAGHLLLGCHLYQAHIDAKAQTAKAIRETRSH